MIESIQFTNFRVLRNATLPLGPFTLIIGPNGSGKSTAMRGIALAGGRGPFGRSALSVTNPWNGGFQEIAIKIHWNISNTEVVSSNTWRIYPDGAIGETNLAIGLIQGPVTQDQIREEIQTKLNRFRIFSFDADTIAAPMKLEPNLELAPNGANLAGVLDSLRDSDPERFDALIAELGRWLPEFDRILFETPLQGTRAFLLRTRNGRHKIPAAELSHGTLLALAFLTLAYVPNPPPIVCFEEPERGIHPRLLREIQDSMYRLAYPQNYGEERQPVQVIATTHSPYLLDLYKDHPEEVVIAQKDEQGAHFERLADKPNIEEFLQDASLGDIWYSGVLGGVPSTP